MNADEFQKQQEEHQQWLAAEKAQKELKQILKEIKHEPARNTAKTERTKEPTE